MKVSDTWSPRSSGSETLQIELGVAQISLLGTQGLCAGKSHEQEQFG